MLPTFLGIGVPRAGTTWLNDLLASHPGVVMSQDRKEIHFFDQRFHQGLGWYERFFPERPATPATPATPVVVGEYTPHYLYDPEVPARIRTVDSIERFVVSFRDPVDRAVSHYRFRQLVDGFDGSFDDFLVAYPHAVEWGYYARHLEPWLATFGRDQFLMLVFEHAVRDVGATKTALAGHLGFDAAAFPAESGEATRNDPFVPRHPRLQRAARQAARKLRSIDADWAIRLARRAGLVGVAKRRRPGRADGTVSDGTRQRLRDLYRTDIDRLRELTGLDLDPWVSAG